MAHSVHFLIMCNKLSKTCCMSTWKNLPDTVVHSPTLSTFKRHLSVLDLSCKTSWHRYRTTVLDFLVNCKNSHYFVPVVFVSLLQFYCHNVVPKYVLTFIYFRPALCFIFVYNCGLTVRNKRICYVMLCYGVCYWFFLC